ncbi:MAG TPA: cation:proton antiporter [Thermoplasmata archaeon]|nr:cation:proton antiporter [Thermoplasmata archaeon]
MAAFVSTEAFDSLLFIFILLAFAELVGSLAQRYRFPPLVAEVLVGVVLSSFAIGGIVDGLLHSTLFNVTPYVLLFADFSVILVIFAAGVEGGFASLRSAGWQGIASALGGGLLSFALATVAVAHFYSLQTALLVGVAVGPTSTAVVAYLIRSGEVAGGAGGQFLLAVSAIDDVAGLILLSVVLTSIGGSFNPIAVTGGIVFAVVAWVVILLASVFVVPRLFRLPGFRQSREMPFLVLFVLVAIVAALGFSVVVGAFIAGLALAETLRNSGARQLSDALLALFGPLFFVVIGVQFDVGLLLNPRLLLLAGLLTSIAILGKLLGILPFAYARFRSLRAALPVAVGAMPRGEIGLIVGSIGVSLGLFGSALFGAIVLMALITTFVGGYLFPYLVGQGSPLAASREVPEPAAPEPSAESES